LKYGRIVADVTGASIANPLRWGMMAAMGVRRGSEAFKEARLKDEKVMENTRIEDAEAAAAEAWVIYEAAQKREGKNWDENPSTQSLKDAYLVFIPADLQKKLQNPAVANDMVQRLLQRHIENRVARLNRKLSNIDVNPHINPGEKETEKENLLKKWQKELEDYDRLVTKYGTVDELGAWARAGQIAGKWAVYGMQVETAAISLYKLYEGIAHVIGEHGNVANSEGADILKHAQGPKGSDIKLPHEAHAVSNATPDSHIAAEASTTTTTIPPEVPTEPLAPAPSISPVEPVPSGAVQAATETGTGVPKVDAVNIESIPVKHNEGGIQKIIDLKAHIREHYHGNYENAPKGIQNLMSSNDAVGQAKQLGFYNPDSENESALLHEGSVFNVDYRTGNISFHDAATGHENILIHGDGAKLEEYGGKMFDADHSAKVPEGQTAESYMKHDIYTTERSIPHTEAELRGKIESQFLKEEELKLPKEDWAPVETTTSTSTGPTPPEPVRLTDREINAAVELSKHPFRIYGTPSAKVMDIYENNVFKILHGENTDIWDSVSDRPAAKVLKAFDQVGTTRAQYDSPMEFDTVHFLDKLRKVTGLKPHGRGLFNWKAETIGEYITRALKKAEKSGVLDKLK
jgi:hypothetical protein